MGMRWHTMYLVCHQLRDEQQSVLQERWIVNRTLVLGRGLLSKLDDMGGIFVDDIGLFEAVQMQTSCKNLVAPRGWMMKRELRFRAEGEKQLSNAGKYWSGVRWCWWRCDPRAMADGATKLPENPLSSRK